MRASLQALLACVLLLGMPAEARAADERPILTIIADPGKCEFQTEELLRHPQLETITLRDLEAFRRQTRTFSAIAAAKLFTCVEMSRDARVEFVARDGYTANIAADALLNTASGKAVAYLAVEDPAAPWPGYGEGVKSPGPFALIWKDPQLSGIGREQWPYNFDRIVVRNTLASAYPQLVPESKAAAFERLQSGFSVFVNNCMACHQLNQIGPGVLGPDLNHPMSPTQYFEPGILRQYIRNPQSVRAHPRSAMGPFPAAMIPDAQLDDLILYLGYMADRK